MSTWNSPWLSDRFSLASWRGSPWQTSRGWNPRYLFLAGQQGAWYDPSDLSTLFLDSAGTTPVTADGDPVGWMLDKSQGPVNGPELVTNGAFSNNVDGWIGERGATVAWDNGRMEVTFPDPSDWGVAEQAISTEIGKTYEIVGTLVSNPDNEPVRLIKSDHITSHINLVRKDNLSEGSHGLLFKATATTTYIGFAAQNSSDTFTSPILVDNISVRELLGNHATQATSASRPVYRTDGTLHWLEFDGVDDYLESPAFAHTAASRSFAAASNKSAAGSVLDSLNQVQQIRNISGALGAVRYDSGGAAAALNSGQLVGQGARVMSAVIDVDASALRLDGSEVLAEAYLPTPKESTEKLSIGRRLNASQYAEMALYGAIYVCSETPEAPQAETYLAKKSGVQL